MLRLGILFIIISLGLGACRKREELVWESDWVLPIAYGTLNFDNLIADSIVSADANGNLSLDFSDTVFSVQIKDLLYIPDTSVTKRLTTPFASTTVNEGVEFIDDPQDFEYTGSNGVQISQLNLERGFIDYTIETPVTKKLVVSYSVPGATLNGVPLYITLTVPAAPTGGKASISGSFDLSGYHLNLRGVSGAEYNKLETVVGVAVAPGEGSATITNQDTIVVRTTFRDVLPSYAKGYFGQQNFSESGQDSIKLLSSYISGMIDIDQINVDLKLSNGIGADGRVKINRLRGINSTNNSFLDLNHSIIGQTININRATDFGGNIQPSSINKSFSTMNSNIDEMLELIPQRFSYDVEMDINPLGNVSNNTDFAYGISSIDAILDVRMPLSLIANNFTLQDTLDLDHSALPVNVLEFTARMEVENGYPLELIPTFYVLDSLGTIAANVAAPTILSASIDLMNNVIANSNQNFDVVFNAAQMETLRNGGRLVVRFTCNTANLSQHVTLNKSQFISIRVIGAGKIETAL